MKPKGVMKGVTNDGSGKRPAAAGSSPRIPPTANNVADLAAKSTNTLASKPGKALPGDNLGLFNISSDEEDAVEIVAKTSVKKGASSPSKTKDSRDSVSKAPSKAPSTAARSGLKRMLEDESADQALKRQKVVYPPSFLGRDKRMSTGGMPPKLKPGNPGYQKETEAASKSSKSVEVPQKKKKTLAEMRLQLSRSGSGSSQSQPIVLDDLSPPPPSQPRSRFFPSPSTQSRHRSSTSATVAHHSPGRQSSKLQDEVECKEEEKSDADMPEVELKVKEEGSSDDEMPPPRQDKGKGKARADSSSDEEMLPARQGKGKDRAVEDVFSSDYRLERPSKNAVLMKEASNGGERQTSDEDTEAEEEVGKKLMTLTPDAKAGRKRRSIVTSRAAAPGRSASTKDTKVANVAKFPTDTYMVPLSDGATVYMHKLMTMASATSTYDPRVNMVQALTSFIAVEKKAGYAPVDITKITSEQRPKEISAWIAGGCHTTYLPEIPDVMRSSDAMESWWWCIAPQWRRDEAREGVLGVSANRDWSELLVTGVNGLVTVLVAVAWWLHAINAMPKGTTREKERFKAEGERAVALLEDIEYCLINVLNIR